MVNKKYYWLRLMSDFFNRREMKKLRKIAGGETYTIIYLKMQLLSITKDGIIVFEKTEKDLSEQLSLELDESVDDINMTLAFLQANGLISEVSSDEILLTEVPSLIGKESASAERVRKHREQKKTEEKKLEALHCNALVTKCNTEKEIEIEIRDRVKDIDNKEKNNIKKESAGAHNKKFVKPTVEEVRTYCQERNNTVDANRFVDYYEANGWKGGRNSMKDWKAAVRTWERREVGGLQSRNIENSTPGSDFEDAVF